MRLSFSFIECPQYLQCLIEIKMSQREGLEIQSLYFNKLKSIVFVANS